MIGNSLAMMAISFLLYMIVCNPETKESTWKEDVCAYSFFVGVIFFLIGIILWVVSKL
jgi:multisubunit Na+/H+ antiporter MnhB subunit